MKISRKGNYETLRFAAVAASAQGNRAQKLPRTGLSDATRRLGKGDQLAPEYIAMNPNKKMPVLEDDGFVLWESNAILFYLAPKKPDRGLWPSDPKRQADVLRWLAWESAHWDSEACGAVGYEKVSKTVLGLGRAEPVFVARGGAEF